MEIGGLPSSSVYTPPQVPAKRPVRAAVTEAGSPGAEQLFVARDPRSDRQAPAELARPAEVQRDRNLRATPADSIQIGNEEGARIMKVHDMKEYLIYQVPAKGQLMLVQADERAAARQVQTSA